MSGFKLIAIRPLEGCSTNFLKVLQVNKVYQFYDNYDFVYESNNSDNAVLAIRQTELILEDLFYQKRNKGGRQPNIHISAIVGKNGSGKSSLVELLYVAMFNIAWKLKLLPVVDVDKLKVEYEERIHAEIYYSTEEGYHKIKVDNAGVKLFHQSLKGNATFNSGKEVLSKSDLNSIFYSIVINYSHYSLNSIHTGRWIKNIFHKNDGYQTPIVINPFRDRGNININTEEYLTRSRLIANLLIETPENSHRILAPNKIADKIKFTLNRSKTKVSSDYGEFGKLLLEQKTSILTIIFRSFSRKLVRKSYDTKDNLILLAYNYIIRKIINISDKYSPYNTKELSFVISIPTLTESKVEKVDLEIDFKIFRAFVAELKKDKSHVTLKLRQAINFIENVEVYRNQIGHFEDLTELTSTLHQLKKSKNVIELIPPSFFNFEIKFKGGSLFQSLSSGEKQKIFSTTTVLYHLINIESVRKRQSNVKYRRVNIIFDEVELYFHPDLQRSFISNLLGSIRNIQLRSIQYINFLFITHSPFILSDIPDCNVIFLDEDGNPSKEKAQVKTFGSNIHELLKESFFLDKGFLGEFAKTTIQDLIAYLKSDNAIHSKNIAPKFKLVWSKKKAEQLIEKIGEPLIRQSLQALYDKKFHMQKREQIVRRISELNAELKKLDK